jgi:hypothetical protein
MVWQLGVVGRMSSAAACSRFWVLRSGPDVASVSAYVVR